MARPPTPQDMPLAAQADVLRRARDEGGLVKCTWHAGVHEAWTTSAVARETERNRRPVLTLHGLRVEECERRTWLRRDGDRATITKSGLEALDRFDAANGGEAAKKEAS